MEFDWIWLQLHKYCQKFATIPQKSIRKYCTNQLQISSKIRQLHVQIRYNEKEFLSLS